MKHSVTIIIDGQTVRATLAQAEFDRLVDEMGLPHFKQGRILLKNMVGGGGVLAVNIANIQAMTSVAVPAPKARPCPRPKLSDLDLTEYELPG